MSILATARHQEQIGGRQRRLLITNAEIERFEAQHIGMYDLWDQLFGHKPGLKVTHVRDIVALALVGGGAPDAEAETLIASMGPEHNVALRDMARRAVGLAYFPSALTSDEKKSPDGSVEGESESPSADAMAQGSGSETSAP